MVRSAVLAVTIMLMALIRYIYPVFIDKKYWESIVYVPILAVSMYYSSLSAFYGGVFSAFKETKILGTTSTYAAVINLLVDLALFKAIGIYAAAVSTLISSCFLYLYRKYKMKKHLKTYEKSDMLIVAIFVVICALFYLNNPVMNFVNAVIAFVLSVLFNRNSAEMLLSKLKDLKNLKVR